MPSFRLDQYQELGDWLKTGMADGARRGLLSAAFRGLGVIQNELIPQEDPQPVDVGAYRAGWRVDADPGGDVSLVNDLPYASVIEYGARAENIKIGRKMIDALAAWAIRKGLVTGKGRDLESAARSTAWAIATAMKERGNFNRDGRQGLRIGERAVKRIREFLPDEIRREVLRKVAR